MAIILPRTPMMTLLLALSCLPLTLASTLYQTWKCGPQILARDYREVSTPSELLCGLETLQTEYEGTYCYRAGRCIIATEVLKLDSWGWRCKIAGEWRGVPEKKVMRKVESKFIVVGPWPYQ